jgi:uncharacterized protein YjbI with pentapeptide repeats
LTGAQLSGANLSGAMLVAVSGRDANFSRANLSNANLSAINLENAILDSANFVRARLQAATLLKASAQGADFRRGTLNNADLRGGDFSYAMFGNTQLKATNFQQATLTGGDLNHANLTQANLSFTFSKFANFNFSNASRASFYGADLTAASLIRTNLILSNLTDTRMNDANLTGARLNGAIFSAANPGMDNLDSYTLGSTGPGGGLIFFVSADGQHGLEAASPLYSPGWGCENTYLGVTATALGSGATNTDLIQERGTTAQCLNSNAPSVMASTFNQGGYQDWYVPSRDEMALLISHVRETQALYWTSSETSATTVWLWSYLPLPMGQVQTNGTTALVGDKSTQALRSPHGYLFYPIRSF